MDASLCLQYVVVSWSVFLLTYIWHFDLSQKTFIFRYYADSIWKHSRRGPVTSYIKKLPGIVFTATFWEEFIFEPSKEEGISGEQLAELEDNDVKLIYLFIDRGRSADAYIIGFDDEARAF